MGEEAKESSCFNCLSVLSTSSFGDQELLTGPQCTVFKYNKLHLTAISDIKEQTGAKEIKKAG